LSSDATKGIISGMFWTDTHVHFDDFEAAGGTAAVLTRARANSVDRCVAIGGSPKANALALRVATGHPDQVRAAVGYDRHLAAAPPGGEELDDQMARPETLAVGECGLDYAGGPDGASAQRNLFERMLTRAVTHRLPMIVHTRMADADTLAMLREHTAARLAALRSPLPGARRWLAPGIIHCFTGDAALAEALAAMGWYISLSGIVTFRNADTLRAAARAIPPDRLLLETDAPYLAPVPMRGKINEPSFLPHTGRFLARWLDLPEEELARKTTENAERVFDWPPG
jgi:TatD DNase family protein